SHAEGARRRAEYADPLKGTNILGSPKYISATLSALKEIADFFANFIRAFEIREVPAFSQQDKAGPGYGLSDVGCTFYRGEIIISTNDQGREVKPFELGQQIVFARQPCFAR